MSTEMFLVRILGIQVNFNNCVEIIFRFLHVPLMIIIKKPRQVNEAKRYS